MLGGGGRTELRGMGLSLGPEMAKERTGAGACWGHTGDSLLKCWVYGRVFVCVQVCVHARAWEGMRSWGDIICLEVKQNRSYVCVQGMWRG